MPISTAPSTFEFTANWLTSSECVVRDVFGLTEANWEEAVEAAKARIYREEVLQEPNEDEEQEDAPDLPPPVDQRPFAIVIMGRRENQLTGTQTWSGRGTLLVAFEVLVPEHLRMIWTDETTPAEKAARFKAGKEWADQLMNTVLQELKATSGRWDEAGNPYLNATDINIELEPTRPESGEHEPDSYMAFMFEVSYR